MMSIRAAILSIWLPLKLTRNIRRADILYRKFQYFSESCLLSSMKVHTYFAYLTVTLTLRKEPQISPMFVNDDQQDANIGIFLYS